MSPPTNTASKYTHRFCTRSQRSKISLVFPRSVTHCCICLRKGGLYLMHNNHAQLITASVLCSSIIIFLKYINLIIPTLNFHCRCSWSNYIEEFLQYNHNSACRHMAYKVFQEYSSYSLIEYTGLLEIFMLSTCYCCHISTKTETCLQILTYLPNIKFSFCDS